MYKVIEILNLVKLSKWSTEEYLKYICTIPYFPPDSILILQGQITKKKKNPDASFQMYVQEQLTYGLTETSSIFNILETWCL